MFSMNLYDKLSSPLSIPLEPMINNRLCPANTSEDEESILT